METINKKYLIWLVVFVAVVIITSVYLSRSSRAPAADRNQPPIDEATTTPAEIITAKHAYRDGVHTIAGEINLPTPCHLLETKALVAESMPEQVVIQFTASTQDASPTDCVQVITPRRFKVVFNASATADITAAYNGAKVILNLIPAVPGENLDNFEVEVKG